MQLNANVNVKVQHQRKILSISVQAEQCARLFSGFCTHINHNLLLFSLTFCIREHPN